jgi:hypothetical protein
MEGNMFDRTASALRDSLGEQVYQTEFETGMVLRLDEAMRLATGEK